MKSGFAPRAALACAIGGLLIALTLAGPARASHCNARIDSEPRGAGVFVSGSLIGTTPLTYVSGSETTISVRLEKKGFKTWTGKVHIPHDGATSLMQKLEPAGKAATPGPAALTAPRVPAPLVDIAWLAERQGDAGIAIIDMLDGGLKKWLAESRPVALDKPAIAPSQFQAGKSRSELLTSLADVEKAISVKSAQLVDDGHGLSPLERVARSKLRARSRRRISSSDMAGV